jgi:hypothetical protein
VATVVRNAKITAASSTTEGRPGRGRSARASIPPSTYRARHDAAQRRTHDYVRHGTTTLFAALEIATVRITRNSSLRCRS